MIIKVSFGGIKFILVYFFYFSDKKFWVVMWIFMWERLRCVKIKSDILKEERICFFKY